MRDGHQATSGRSAQPPDEVAQLLHELAEALTALANYGAAAALISGPDPIGADIREVLEASQGQHERAAKALQRLRRLLMR